MSNYYQPSQNKISNLYVLLIFLTNLHFTLYKKSSTLIVFPKAEIYTNNLQQNSQPSRSLIRHVTEQSCLWRRKTCSHVPQRSVQLYTSMISSVSRNIPETFDIDIFKLHGYTVHQTMLKTFYYQLMHTMLKNTELLKHSKITLQHVSVYIETIFRELQSVLD